MSGIKRGMDESTDSTDVAQSSPTKRHSNPILIRTVPCLTISPENEYRALNFSSENGSSRSLLLPIVTSPQTSSTHAMDTQAQTDLLSHSISPDKTGPHLSLLPDDVLLHVLRRLSSIVDLLQFVSVCKRFNMLVRTAPELWRSVRFHDVRFVRRVEYVRSARSQSGDLNSVEEICTRRYNTSSGAVRRRPRMSLRNPKGEAVLSLAADCGNRYAQLLLSVLFFNLGLNVVTLRDLDAVSILGKRSRRNETTEFFTVPYSFPRGQPAWIAVHAVGDHSVARISSQGHASSPEDTAFLHRTRAHAETLAPRGAIIGLVHVIECVQLENGSRLATDGSNYSLFRNVDSSLSANSGSTTSGDQIYLWKIDTVLRLKRPITCAGYRGIWTIGSEMAEILVRAEVVDEM